MKKPARKPARLELKRQTLRALSSKDLAKVAGGYASTRICRPSARPDDDDRQ